TRKLMLVAALVMSVFVLASVLATTLLVPDEGLRGPARHRALAYLAHGGTVVGRDEGEGLDPLGGWLFGTVYDLSSVLILGLAGFFLVMAAVTVWFNASGLAIALAFIAAVFGTAFASRWWRSTELRFQGFTFADEESRKRWEEIRNLEFQVLVPHRPTHMTLE